MSFSSLTVDAFLAAVASKTPAPGGGAVAGAAGALSAALASMVVAYSVDKKSLAEHQPTLIAAAERLDRARIMLLTLAHEDAQAYAAVNLLSKLPESDPRRATEYAEAVQASVTIPLAALAACVDLLRLFRELAGISNRALRSDLAIAAILAEASARSSNWNVLINVASLPEESRSATRQQLEAMLADAHRLMEEVEEQCAV
jgi:formiminotetrahydrofolate cyclodeaminase